MKSEPKPRPLREDFIVSRRRRGFVGVATPSRARPRMVGHLTTAGRSPPASGGPEVVHTLTRSQPPGWTGYARRVDGEMLAETAWPGSSMPSAFVCGPTPFVESVTAALVLLGYPATSVKTERFGPTGG